MTKVIAGVAAGMLCAGVAGAQPPRSAARAARIAWVKDLATAQKQARSQQNLVLQFLMLGDLTDPHC